MVMEISPIKWNWLTMLTTLCIMEQHLSSVFSPFLIGNILTIQSNNSQRCDLQIYNMGIIVLVHPQE